MSRHLALSAGFDEIVTQSANRAPPGLGALPRLRAIALLAPLLVLLVVPATAELPPPEAEPRESGLVEHLEVEMVELEVRVTDRRGRPVTGLTAEDFRLWVDGREVAITSFYAVEGSRRVAEGEAGEDTVEGGAPTVLPLHLVAYVDAANLHPLRRGRVLDALEAHLAREVPLGTRVMLVSSDRSLRVVRNFTSDLEDLRAGVAELRDLPAPGHDRVAELRTALQGIRWAYELYETSRLGGSPCGEEGAWPQMVAMARQHARSVEHRTAGSMAHLGTVAGAMGGLPRPKALLWVSDGVPAEPGIEVFELLRDLCQDTAEASHSSELQASFDPISRFRQVTAEASANGVVIYTLEGAGPSRGAGTAAEHDGSRFAFSARHDQVRLANLRSSLFNLASETGGRAFFDLADPADGLAELAQAVGTYYSLGFLTDHAAEGATHYLRVRTAQRGLSVHHPSAFLHRTADERHAGRMAATLFFGAEDNPLGVDAELRQEAGEGLEPGGLELALTLTLAAAPGSPGLPSEVEALRVLVAIHDAEGGVRTLRRGLLALPASSEEEADPTPRQLVIRLPPGTAFDLVVLGVIDPGTGLASYLRLPAPRGAQRGEP